MFKKGDRVIHPAYGKGTVWKIHSKRKLKYIDKNNNPIILYGTIDVAFDSELSETDDGEQKTLTFLLDGRESPIGSGYFVKDKFYPFWDEIEITKLEESE